MATFKETREILLANYASNVITIEEYALLFEENSSNNLDFPYYNYPPFNWESQSEAEGRANFRVEKHHIALVEGVLQIPQYFICDQGSVEQISSLHWMGVLTKIISRQKTESCSSVQFKIM